MTGSKCVYGFVEKCLKKNIHFCSFCNHAEKFSTFEKKKPEEQNKKSPCRENVATFYEQ